MESWLGPLLALLSIAPPDTKAFSVAGTSLPKGAIRRLGTTNLRHVFHINDCAWSPDATMLATVAQDRIVQLWSSLDGSLIRAFPALNGHVLCVRFSDDGSRLVTGTDIGIVQVWDVSNGRQLVRLGEHKESVTFVAFANGDREVVSKSTDLIRLSSAAAGTELSRISGAFYTAVFSPDLKTVLAGDACNYTAWDVRAAQRLPWPSFKGWAVYRGPSFSPDGALIVGTEADRIGLHSAVDGSLVAKISGISDLRFSMFAHAISPDGSVVATSVAVYNPDLQAKPVIQIWDRQKQQKLVDLPGLHYSSDLFFSPDGSRLAIVRTGRGSSGCGNCDSGIRRSTGRLTFPATVTVWDWKSQRRVFSHEVDSIVPGRAAFSPDGSKIAFWGFGPSVRIWDAQTGKPVVEPESHHQTVTALHFSLDGSELWSGSADHTIRRWSATTGKPIDVFHSRDEGVHQVVVSRDGQYLAALHRTCGLEYEHPVVRVWNVKTGQAVTRLATSELRGVQSIAFNDANELVAIGIPGSPSLPQWWTFGVPDLLRAGVKHPADTDDSDPPRVAAAPDDTDAPGDRRLWALLVVAGLSITTALRHSRTNPSLAVLSVLISIGAMGVAIPFTAAPPPEKKPNVAPKVEEQSLLRRRRSYPKDDQLSEFGANRKTVLPPEGMDLSNIWWTVLSADGRRAAFISNKNNVYLIDVATQSMEEITTVDERATLLGLSADGSRVAIRNEKAVEVWKVDARQKILTIPVETKPMLTGTKALFSPTNSLFAITRPSDTITPRNYCTGRTCWSGTSLTLRSRIEVWDLTTGDQVANLDGHPGAIESLAFHPDESRLASGGNDATIFVWDLASARRVAD